MPTAESQDELWEEAERVLRGCLGAGVRLSAPRLIRQGGRNRVARCVVEGAGAGVSSVVVKEIREQPERGFTDWASLVFLQSLPATAALVPGLYGGDPARRFFVMEDLGASRSLEDVLQGSDPAALARVLRNLAIVTARLHSGTLGEEARFAAERRALPVAQEEGRHIEARRWLAGREKLTAWFDAAGCRQPDGFPECLEGVAEVYAEPGSFLCFTHGDPAPTNNHVSGEAVRLLDFEYGGFRHALYDLTAWYVLCPLPAPLVRKMSAYYRAELVKACPVAGDDALYRDAWACLCAYRALAMLTWISPDILRENRPWVGEWSAREAVVAALSRLEQATTGSVSLEPVAEGARRLGATLRTRWRAEGELLPRWPALAS